MRRIKLEDRIMQIIRRRLGKGRPVARWLVAMDIIQLIQDNYRRRKR